VVYIRSINIASCAATRRSVSANFSLLAPGISKRNLLIVLSNTWPTLSRV
jgi:hypothetical protein